ncbi:putative lipoprotein [Caballeronia novacaledonica]|uniref:Putative lipoprotein n=1 Tax=Caballeronia novacaledonica TaxID=1544861 RepID=A0A2U3I348_9BURK|nr:DUF3540 domain-containing protein [Caballeronia novacaledonica]SPB14560.1 putative lipoprotein [Caballeronia novacaledonica]
MKNTLVPLARAGHEHAVCLTYATVTGRAGKWFFVSAADASVDRALRADSCLIEPDCGDAVLVCRGGALGANAAAYIVALLARASADGAQLLLPGGVALHASQGDLQVEAARIELKASGEVSLQAPAIGMEGVHGEMRFHRMDASINEVHARLGIVSTMAQQVTSTVGRLVQKARDSFRWIEKIDETRAGRVRMKVNERLHVTARDVSVLAQGHVKIDGDKIDLG